MHQNPEKTKMKPCPVFSGLLSKPCGVWVSPYRMRSGLVWGRPLGAVTKQSILKGAYHG
jgi:hypothetical protein